MPAHKPFPLAQISLRFAAIVAAGWLASSTHAVILFRTGLPAENTSAPGGSLAGSGWQYEGKFGAFLGTAIAAHFFLTAKHIGKAGSVFAFQGVNYTLVRQFADPNSDLSLWQVTETFPSFAPLYTESDEATDINYVVEQSADLASWIPAVVSNEIVSTAGNLQTIKAKMDIGGATQLFLRLQITRQ